MAAAPLGTVKPAAPYASVWLPRKVVLPLDAVLQERVPVGGRPFVSDTTTVKEVPFKAAGLIEVGSAAAKPSVSVQSAGADVSAG